MCDVIGMVWFSLLTWPSNVAERERLHVQFLMLFYDACGLNKLCSYGECLWVDLSSLLSHLLVLRIPKYVVLGGRDAWLRLLGEAIRVSGDVGFIYVGV